MTADPREADAYRDLIGRHLHRPWPPPIREDGTGVPRRVRGVRAVFFDVYGTLLFSAPAEERVKGEQLAALVEEYGLPIAAAELPSRLAGEIARAHRAAAGRTDHPEVDIIKVWSGILGGGDRPKLKRLALEYELVTHPCRPAADLGALFGSLRDRGIALGIVSNSQFYTQPILEYFAGRRLQEIGFDKNLLLYSYRYRIAKPSRRLFEKAACRLNRLGLAPEQALCIGDSLENDIRPAKAADFKTALFQGARQPVEAGESETVAADAVFSDWNQIDKIIS